MVSHAKIRALYDLYSYTFWELEIFFKILPKVGQMCHFFAIFLKSGRIFQDIGDFPCLQLFKIELNVSLLPKISSWCRKMQKYVLKFVYASPKNVTRSTFPKPHIYVKPIWLDTILLYAQRNFTMICTFTKVHFNKKYKNFAHFTKKG